MSSRDEILAKIRKNTVCDFPKPDYTALEKEAMTFPDTVKHFCEMLEVVGGQAIFYKEGDDVNTIIRNAYPDAKRIASTMPEITCATFNPNDLESPHELNGTDLAVLQAHLGVAENGALWYQQDNQKHRAIFFIPEALVFFLDKSNIVNNMHEVYKKIADAEYEFGGFISGPSKTADIEQALVFGAHGARKLTVLIKE